MTSSHKAQRRAISRSLRSITPETCHPQRGSPLFSVLPPELRNQIFALACSQHRKSQLQSYSGGWNNLACPPRRKYAVQTSTSLLQTCRLVYYETHMLPLQSTTHYIDTSVGWNNFDHYLFHLTKAQQRDLFHLHLSIYNWSARDNALLSKFTRGDGMNWERITLAKPWYTDMPHLFMRWDVTGPKDVLPIRLPLSCTMFVFELEVLKNAEPDWAISSFYDGPERLAEFVQQVKRYALWRIDGSCFAPAVTTVESYNWSTPNVLRSDTRGAVPLGTHVECEGVRLVWKGAVGSSGNG